MQPRRGLFWFHATQAGTPRTFRNRLLEAISRHLESDGSDEIARPLRTQYRHGRMNDDCAKT
jgi:hypothetical protein